MWTNPADRRNRKRRKDLLISSAQGKATSTAGVGPALSDGASEGAAGKIVIFGWTGEQFVTSASSRSTAPTRAVQARREPEGARQGTVRVGGDA